MILAKQRREVKDLDHSSLIDYDCGYLLRDLYNVDAYLGTEPFDRIMTGEAESKKFVTGVRLIMEKASLEGRKSRGLKNRYSHSCVIMLACRD